MNGFVDQAGRALIDLEIRAHIGDTPQTITAWIDTAFTRELVLSRVTIKTLNLPESGAIMAGLADGGQVVLKTYRSYLNWQGADRLTEVIENDGHFPLMGIGLLVDHKATIDYPNKSVAIE